MFNFTKDEWQKINASGAYDSIINGIKEAKQKIEDAQQLIQNATKIITPDNSDDMTDKANLAHAYSDRLKKRINNFKSISKGKIFVEHTQHINEYIHIIYLQMSCN